MLGCQVGRQDRGGADGRSEAPQTGSAAMPAAGSVCAEPPIAAGSGGGPCPAGAPIRRALLGRLPLCWADSPTVEQGIPAQLTRWQRHYFCASKPSSGSPWWGALPSAPARRPARSAQLGQGYRSPARASRLPCCR